MIQRAAVAGSLGALLLLLSVGAPVRPGASRVESAGRSASASLLPFMDRRGQAPTEAPDTGPRPDSVRALRAAKAALRESGTSAWTSRIARVIEELDAQAREIPGDGWIAGHRVGLRMKQGDFADALAVALDCQAAAWWCAALEGLALHAKGDFVEAESAFDRALEAMPRGERCDWLNELRPVLSGDLAKEYGRLSCSGRADLEHRIWWLADPLYLRPGNDRRTEHLARVVSMHLHHQVLELRGGRCPTDHHEPVLRAARRRPNAATASSRRVPRVSGRSRPRPRTSGSRHRPGNATTRRTAGSASWTNRSRSSGAAIPWRSRPARSSRITNSRARGRSRWG
jgi:hypothetical protein